MHAVDEPVHDVARDQLEIPDARQDNGVDKARAWN